MLRPSLIVALAAMTAIAAEPKFGLIVEGLLPRPDFVSPFEPSLSVGGMAALEARFNLDEKITIAPFVGFEYIKHGVEAEENGAKAELTFNSKFLPVGASFELALTPEFRLALTPEIDVSLGGDGSIELSSDGDVVMSGSGDIEGEKSPFLVGFGIVYGATEKSALLLGYKFAASEYLEEDGEQYTLNKFYLGGRFAI